MDLPENAQGVPEEQDLEMAPPVDEVITEIDTVHNEESVVAEMIPLRSSPAMSPEKNPAPSGSKDNPIELEDTIPEPSLHPNPRSMQETEPSSKPRVRLNSMSSSAGSATNSVDGRKTPPTDRSLSQNEPSTSSGHPVFSPPVDGKKSRHPSGTGSDTFSASRRSASSSLADSTQLFPLLHTSIWAKYIKSRVYQSAQPQQRNLMDRQHALLKMFAEDHSYNGKMLTGRRSMEGRYSTSAVSGDGRANAEVAKTKKTLFCADFQSGILVNGDWSAEADEEHIFIDVVTDEESPRSPSPYPYDRKRAYEAMNQMENYMMQLKGPVEIGNSAAKEKDGKTEEDPLLKTYARRGSWTHRQRTFFDQCIKIIQQERHVRLASCGNPDVPIIRRLSSDKAAARFRRLMASVEWSGRLVYWLHAVLLAGLNPQMLSVYFEILQTLRPKIPELINSLLTYMLPDIPDGNTAPLMSLLNEPWDPVGKSVYRFEKTVKLPKNPILVVAPHPYAKNQDNCAHSRLSSITKFLTRLGSVVQVECPNTNTLTPSELYTNMLINTRDTLIELRKAHPDRPSVVFGLGIGAMVACQTSLLEPCDAIICLGFPLKTPKGFHGDYGDPLLKLDAAVQFIVGMEAGNCPHAEFQEFWEKLNCDTEVVWAAGCDDYLRMKSAFKMSLKVTQTMVDRNIMEEIIKFLQIALQKDRVRKAEVATPEPASKKRKTASKAASPSKTTPVKKPKTAMDIPSYSARKDLLISDSTSSSQETQDSTPTLSSEGTTASSSKDFEPAISPFPSPSATPQNVPSTQPLPSLDSIFPGTSLAARLSPIKPEPLIFGHPARSPLMPDIYDRLLLEGNQMLQHAQQAQYQRSLWTTPTVPPPPTYDINSINNMRNVKQTSSSSSSSSSRTSVISHTNPRPPGLPSYVIDTYAQSMPGKTAGLISFPQLQQPLPKPVAQKSSPQPLKKS